MTSVLQEQLRNKKGVFYGRVSSQEQDLQMQIDSCKGFREKNYCDVTIDLQKYVEKISATRVPLTKREALMKVIKAVKNKEYDFIVVYNHDRLARDPLEHLRLRKWFADLQVSVYLSSSNQVYSNKDILSNAIRDNYSKIEADNIRVRMKDSIYSRVVFHGKWTGGKPPFGVCYQYDDVLKMKVLQFEKDKTKIIREIFKQYKGGLGFNSIAAYLNIHHPLSGQQWSKERAKSIITNPIYCGYLSIHKRKKGSRNSTTNRDEWIMERYKELDPIIELVEWEYCYDLYMKRKTREISNPQYFSTPYLFKDIIQCRQCGKPLLTKNQSSGQYGDQIYCCGRTSDCHIRIVSNELDDYLINYIKKSVILNNNIEQRDLIIERIKEFYISQKQELEVERSCLYQKLQDLRQDLDATQYQLHPLLVTQSDRIAIDVLQTLSSILTNDIADTHLNLKRNSDAIKRLEILELESNHWDHFLDDTLPINKDQSHQVRKLLLLLFEKIEIDNDGGIYITNRIDLNNR
ncbi:recombinase family protein [Paenibacillus sp. FSL R10-2199]|uniref:recombinase family protein n=1 Tax=Paenibacillus sp. FSL R10-2199 TaxID=2975348 RepID=UPI0030F8C65A